MSAAVHRAQNRGQSLSLKAAVDHLSAIPSEGYEIGVFDPRAFGGDGRMILRHWSHDEVLKAFTWLRYSNAHGCEIYVRPASPHPYTLLDDLTGEALRRLDDEGFAPSVVVQTSPGNFQAWLRGGTDLPESLSTQVARVIARRFGADLSSADWRHFGRMAGFTNNKPQHRNVETGLQPYVRLIRSERRIYREAEPTLELARRELEELRIQEQRRKENVRGSIKDELRPMKQISDFHNSKRYGGDLNRADLAYAVYALSHGVPATAVAEHLGVRDLSKKGSVARQNAYIDRTLRKAERKCSQ